MGYGGMKWPLPPQEEEILTGDVLVVAPVDSLPPHPSPRGSEKDVYVLPPFIPPSGPKFTRPLKGHLGVVAGWLTIKVQDVDGKPLSANVSLTAPNLNAQYVVDGSYDVALDSVHLGAGTLTVEPLDGFSQPSPISIVLKPENQEVTIVFRKSSILVPVVATVGVLAALGIGFAILS
jgi:hypothetical protein